MPRVPFAKGNKLGKGGVRPGAGRPPDRFKAKMRKIYQSPAAMKFLQDALEGKDVEPQMSEGSVIMTPASTSARHRIWESLHDRDKGKPASVLDMGDEDGITFIGVMRVPTKDKGRMGGVRKA